MNMVYVLSICMYYQNCNDDFDDINWYMYYLYEDVYEYVYEYVNMKLV